jgi:hypothetical protein
MQRIQQAIPNSWAMVIECVKRSRVVTNPTMTRLSDLVDPWKAIAWTQAGESNPDGLIGTLASPGTPRRACDVDCCCIARAALIGRRNGV